MKPTADEIEAVFAAMRGEASVYPPYDSDDDGELWWVSVYSPTCEWRGCGSGFSLSEARATAWISACDQDGTIFSCWAPSERTFFAVPRQVPDGWTFIVDDFPVEVCGVS